MVGKDTIVLHPSFDHEPVVSEIPSKLVTSQELVGETLCEMQNEIVKYEVRFEESMKDKDSELELELSESESIVAKSESLLEIERFAIKDEEKQEWLGIVKNEEKGLFSINTLHVSLPSVFVELTQVQKVMTNRACKPQQVVIDAAQGINDLSSWRRKCELEYAY